MRPRLFRNLSARTSEIEGNGRAPVHADPERVAAHGPDFRQRDPLAGSKPGKGLGTAGPDGEERPGGSLAEQRSLEPARALDL